MSKSLKNFTTIKEALGRGDWTPRGMRIVFLLGGWKDSIELTVDIRRAAAAWESKLNNFFIIAKDVIENPPLGPDLVKDNHPLAKELRDARKNTYIALCDSFDTP